jgi:hypothetical protein
VQQSGKELLARDRSGAQPGDHRAVMAIGFADCHEPRRSDLGAWPGRRCAVMSQARQALP